MHFLTVHAQTRPAVYLHEFKSAEEYKEVLEVVRECGGVLLKNEERRWMCVTPAAGEAAVLKLRSLR